MTEKLGSPAMKRLLFCLMHAFTISRASSTVASENQQKLKINATNFVNELF
jgi:hypothetical protein